MINVIVLLDISEVISAKQLKCVITFLTQLLTCANINQNNIKHILLSDTPQLQVASYLKCSDQISSQYTRIQT